jgi:hypothetical protein
MFRPKRPSAHALYTGLPPHPQSGRRAGKVAKKVFPHWRGLGPINTPPAPSTAPHLSIALSPRSLIFPPFRAVLIRAMIFTMNTCAMTLTVTRDDITLAIAVLGAVLGLLNTLRALAKDRPRLRVNVKGWLTGYGDSGFCIEIANTGFVPVSVSQVGILLRRPRGQVFLFAPYGIGVQSFPHALGPGESMTVYAPPGTDEHPALAHATRAFARTATGLEFRSPRRDVRRQLAHHASA